MSREDFYSVRKRYRQESRRTEREYARQATSLAAEVPEMPRRALKAAISGDPNSWGLPDFSFDVNVGNRAGYRGKATVTDEIAEGFLDVAGDPLNVVGSGLFTGGLKAAKQISGADSLRGNMLTSAPNFIDNFYGPSRQARPTVVDEIMSSVSQSPRVRNLPVVGSRVPSMTPQESADFRERAGSFGWWLADAADRGVRQALSPTDRARYRQTGVNETVREVAKDALDSGTARDRAKGVAQVQASGVLIPDQAGRRGSVSPDVEDIKRRSYLTEPVPVTTGSYKELIRSNKLQGSYESGRAVSVTDKDLDIISNHVSKVWENRAGQSMVDTPGAHMRIKNAGAGDQVTGQHHFDFQSKSGVHASFKPMFKDGALSEEELFNQAKKRSDANKKYNANRDKRKDPARWTLADRSNTLEGAKEHGIWVTGSFNGRAITEGGVNYLAKVSPNGRIMAVVSDEHNFLEKTPGVGRLVEGALPNRSVSVTPPMHYDLIGGRKKVKPEQPQDKKDVDESLRNIVNTQPSREAVRAEQAVNAGAGLVGTGMLTGGKDEEQR